MSENTAVGAGSLGRTIFRIVKNPDNPYVMIDKRPVENKGLSWGAKGLLVYMLSRPDNWEFNVTDLINRSTDGAFAVRGYMAELRGAGHLNYAGRIFLPGGRGTRAVWEVHEMPFTKPRSGFHTVVTTMRKTRTTNTDSTNTDDDKADINLAVVCRLYEAEIGPITAITADLIRNATIDFPLEWFEPAIKIACGNNVRKWNYVEAILRSWQTNGFGWKPAGKGKGGNGNGKGKPLEPKEVSPEELERLRAYAKQELGGVH